MCGTGFGQYILHGFEAYLKLTLKKPHYLINDCDQLGDERKHLAFRLMNFLTNTNLDFYFLAFHLLHTGVGSHSPPPCCESWFSGWMNGQWLAIFSIDNLQEGSFFFNLGDSSWSKDFYAHDMPFPRGTAPLVLQHLLTFECNEPQGHRGPFSLLFPGPWCHLCTFCLQIRPPEVSLFQRWDVWLSSQAFPARLNICLVASRPSLSSYLNYVASKSFGKRVCVMCMNKCMRLLRQM